MEKIEIQYKQINVVDNVATGRLVRDERNRLGRSQDDIAAAVGVSKATVCKLERGDGKWYPARLQRFLEALAAPRVDAVTGPDRKS